MLWIKEKIEKHNQVIFFIIRFIILFIIFFWLSGYIIKSDNNIDFSCLEISKCL